MFSNVHINIYLYSSPPCWWSSAGGVLVFTAGSMVQHCSTAVEDGGLEAAADGDPPQCWEKASGWTGSVGLTQPSPGNISPCHEALLRTSQRKRNNINHITSIFIFQFHSTYIKYDLDIEIGLLIILTASTARACTLYPCLDNM